MGTKATVKKKKVVKKTTKKAAKKNQKDKFPSGPPEPRTPQEPPQDKPAKKTNPRRTVEAIAGTTKCENCLSVGCFKPLPGAGKVREIKCNCGAEKTVVTQ